ncbi:Predicted transcriptional regulator [Moraxella lacunata]|uniref:Transcriptional regulator n=1 Tax=Moraxella lacunata TaxID=477 RepID=A0A1V4GMV7_MORLA|nr:helix-turn-helix transcriptional regulator [Moraxella lacunata]OPH33758.1 transcriptional regulator [Moraxella lacunata]STY98657.1 Predicted transcriptional regulator [Moraxella lacunata]
MTIQDNIRHIRESHNLTQENMAELLNMTASGYAKIERGATQLKFEKLEKIAQILNMDVVELLELGDSGDVVIQLPNNSGDNATANYYLNANEKLVSEIEKLNLKIEHQAQLLVSKDELILEKDKQIQALKDVIDLLKQGKN